MIKQFVHKAIPIIGTGRLKTAKTAIHTIIGVKNVLRLRSLLGRNKFEEINIIYQFFNGIATKSKTMIDVGSHQGGSLANFAFDEWKVFAFEPDDNNREILIERYGKFPLVSIDQRAVSDKNEKNIQFYSSDVSTGISGLSHFHPSHKKSQRVETITLRAFIESSDITSVDFLKIDTEGFDLMVLKGVPWESFQPSVILCEFEDKKTVPLGYTFHDLAKYLTHRGYHLLISEWYPVVEYGRTHTWRCFLTYPCDLIDKDAYGNIIAIKDRNWYYNLFSIAERYEKVSRNLG